MEPPRGRTALTRCAWAGDDPLMRAYHDEEWGVPRRDPRMLWEMLMLEGFQAGLAWITVLRKRAAFRAAFAGFEPRKVARFGDRDVERLMGDAGIIRSRAKIDATIRGARIYQEMEEQWGSSTTIPCAASGATRSERMAVAASWPKPRERRHIGAR